MGGAQSALILIGAVFARMFARQLMYAAMIENIYHTDQIGKRKVDKFNKKKKSLHRKRRNSSMYEVSKASIETEKPEDDASNVNRKQILGTILGRLRLRFTLKDICKLFFCCVSLRSFESPKNRKKYRKQIMFKKAVRNLDYNFDALSLLKKMK